MKTLLRLYTAALIASAFLFPTSCMDASGEQKATAENAEKKIGLLLVNHGSRSATWRQAMYDLEASVKVDILMDGNIGGIKTAHMEYTEPSIASQLKAFDKEGFTDIIISPVFLTVSPHTFDDIPTIIGQKTDPQSLEVLKIEKIERYTPKARTYITPNLDFTSILRENILRRTSTLSEVAEKEGLVLIGYGDETYDKEWGELFDNIAGYVKEKKGIGEHSYAWCGHIVHYNPDFTTTAINKVLEKKERAIVIPVLVAHDEMFQVRIIGDGINQVEGWRERVKYLPDAILPDENVNAWIKDIAATYAGKIRDEEKVAVSR